MATSDSPLNVPNVTLAVARGASAPPSNLPASFQLTEGNYSPRNVDPILIYPRPDSETAAWTKHRRHYPGIPYRVPIGVAFGSGPLVYELISGPPGATIGEFLVVSGDTLVPNEDYGVLKWANPTAGNHSFHVRVSFQDGFTPIDVQWTLEVTTSGTIFIDTVAGSDTTGDGSIGNPFQTINAWWKNDLSDTTYSEYQVCYRGGTHDITAENTNTGIDGGSWRLEGTDKPLVHYPYPGENVVWDMSNTTIVMGIFSSVLGTPHASDCYFGPIEYNGGRLAEDNPRQFVMFGNCSSDRSYPAGGSGQRMTFDSPHHKNFVFSTTSSNNAACLWSSNPGTNNKRHFMYVHRPTFTNCEQTVGDPANFNGYYLSSAQNLLSDHITCVDTKFGRAPLMPKAGAQHWCIRWADHTQAPAQTFHFTPSGNYDSSIGGPAEFSYLRATNTATNTNSSVMEPNILGSTYQPDNPEFFPIYLTRCTLSRYPVTNRSVLRILDNWPMGYNGNLFVADDVVYLEPDPTEGITLFSIANNPLDANLHLTGAARTANLGLAGAEIKAE